MIEQITKYRASDKTDHESAFAAWKHELKIWLIINGADNEAIAGKIVKTIDDGRPESLNELAEIVLGMQKHAPPALVEIAA